MYVERRSWLSANSKVYETILLRHSYREGKKVKKRTVANLTHYPPEDVNAIELALKHKRDLAALGSLKGVELKQGLSVGAAWTVYQVAKRLGLAKALGTDVQGKLALWQVIARVMDQSSRLAAVRLAQAHAACDVLGLRRGFDENDLYDNLTWLCDHQEEIERRLFRIRRNRQTPKLFLYDVTASYLEGQQNELGAYGYPRDGKKGKLQIVIGLLCDEYGEPVSTEVFQGNTQDPATFGSQISKVARRFSCQQITFVGDRGMIKNGQIEDLSRAGFHYITAITKPQIRALLKKGVIQMELFDITVCEVQEDGVRYVLRRNPDRAEEIAATRSSKRQSIEKILKEKMSYLREHGRARVSTAEKEIRNKIEKLKVDSWLSVGTQGRTLKLEVDESSLEEISRLDGCYVIKTDLVPEVADMQVVHDRYKDLIEVEHAFRTCKTAHLEIRPVHVRTEEHTRGHVLVVMLAYLVVRALRHAWAEFDLTVEEGLDELKTICSMEISVQGGGSCLRLPQPNDQCRDLLERAEVHLPEALPHKNTRVVTRKKLPERRRKP